jgi:hypothetical protein
MKTATTDTLEALGTELAKLNARLTKWQEQIREEFRKNYESGKLTADSGMAEQQEALRLALARAGEGPRRELNQAIDQLCQLYLEGSQGQRDKIRGLLGNNSAILHDLWGYIARAAEQVRGGGGVAWLRAGLAVVAMEDLRADHHDTLHGLGELYLAADKAGLDPQKQFADAAALCSSEGLKDGRSTRELLASFFQSEYFLQQVQPQLAGNRSIS